MNTPPFLHEFEKKFHGMYVGYLSELAGRYLTPSCGNSSLVTIAARSHN
jgi:hypothetical protein